MYWVSCHLSTSQTGPYLWQRWKQKKNKTCHTLSYYMAWKTGTPNLIGIKARIIKKAAFVRRLSVFLVEREKKTISPKGASTYSSYLMKQKYLYFKTQSPEINVATESRQQPTASRTHTVHACLLHVYFFYYLFRSMKQTAGPLGWQRTYAIVTTV